MNDLQVPKCRPAAASPPSPSEYTSVHRHTHKPAQKRQRTTRACDECRQKKIKCDGQCPCEHCGNYGYNCSYDRPSFRTKHPTQESVENLKSELSRMQALVATILPDFDVNSPTLDDCELAPATSSTGRPRHEIQANFGTAPPFQPNASSKVNPLETILGVAGQFDPDAHGNWDYHGHSSGSAFLRRLGEHFDNLNISLLRLQAAPQVPEQDGVSGEYSFGGYSHGLTPLPPKNVARGVVSSALDDACALVKFVHQPSFYHMFDRIYDIEFKDYGRKEHEFLPLLYASLAVGYLFSKISPAKSGSALSTPPATRYFIACRRMLNVVECRSLLSLQALIFMTIFQHSSSKMSTCHSYIMNALAASLQMGLHRCDAQIFDPVEREIRKRIFWTIRNMEIYVVTILGLPRIISDEDVDQELPSEVDDEYITQEGVLLMPEGQISAIAACNAHTKLLLILAKIIRRVYPPGHAKMGTNGISRAFIVNDTNIRDVERDLDNWVVSLPSHLRRCAESATNHTKIQYLLRMALMHVRMVLYRPFIHYISRSEIKSRADGKCRAYAAACVDVGRSIIGNAREMEEHDVLNGPYWFSIYTMFFATISLVFYTWENAQVCGGLQTLKDAEDGRDILVRLGLGNMAAARCSATLATIFAQLPGRFTANGRVMGIRDDSMPLGQSMERRELQSFKVDLGTSGTLYNLGGPPSQHESFGETNNETNDETNNATIVATLIQVGECLSQEDPPKSVHTMGSYQTRSAFQHQTTDRDSLSKFTAMTSEVDSNFQQTGLNCYLDDSAECNHDDILEVQALNLLYSNSMESLPYNFPWPDTVLEDPNYATIQADHLDEEAFEGLAINQANF